MHDLSRKQREILDREQFILDIASDMLQSGGYLGLNMDKIAEAAEYSKGTIYQHFSCKEEVLCALCIRNLELQSYLFQRAVRFKGNTREKMLAILIAHQLFVKLYTREFSNLSVIKTASIRDKISAQSNAQLRKTEDKCLSCLATIIEEATSKRELILDEKLTTEEIIFGCWSLSFGAALLQTLDVPLKEMGIHDPIKTLRTHCAHLLDGHQWKPLSTEWDYEDSFKRICKDLYKTEIQQLKRMGSSISL